MKVHFPTKETIISAEWRGWYEHFNKRLRERCGLTVTFEEYMELCHAPFETVKKRGQNNAIGYIEIHGQRIKVAKVIKRRRILKTVLTP